MLGDLHRYFHHLVLAGDTGLPSFEPFVFRYTAFEACMALKARILLWAMDVFPQEQQFAYFDSDILASSRFTELESVLPTADIVVTPHHVHDEDSRDGVQDNMIRTLMCGTFNSGFLAVRRSPSACEFLRWWDSKLQKFCYKDDSYGLFFEQKWLDLAPALFDLTILRDPGYNVANWNLAARGLRLDNSSQNYLVNGQPLRFFHFSMIDFGRDMFYFTKHVPRDNAVFALRSQYLLEINQLDVSGLSHTPWSYDFFSSGDRISEQARHRFRKYPELASDFPRPFSESNDAIALACARFCTPSLLLSEK